MRRRICLVGAALSAVPLALGFGATALAAQSHPTHSSRTAVTTTCTTQVGVMIPSGSYDVTPPASSGHEYGTASCGKMLGRGVQSDKFVVPDSGDTVATFTWFLPTGTIHGKFDLTPEGSSFDFLATDYVGDLTVSGGSGTFRSAQGTGTMTCHSPDGVRTECTDKLKLKSL